MPSYRSIPDSNNVETFDDSSVTLLQNIQRVDAGSVDTSDDETIANTPTSETFNGLDEITTEEGSASSQVTAGTWNETMRKLRSHVAFRKANTPNRCKDPRYRDPNIHDIAVFIACPQKKWKTVVNGKAVEVTIIEDQPTDAAGFNHAQIDAYAGPIHPGAAQVVGRRLDQIVWLFKGVLSAADEQYIVIQLEKTGHMVWLEPAPALTSTERSTIIFQSLVNRHTPASMDADSRNGLLAIGDHARFGVFYYKLEDFSKAMAERESDFAGAPGAAGPNWSSIGTIVNGRVKLDFNIGLEGLGDSKGRELTVMVDVVLRSFEQKAGASTKLGRAKQVALGRAVRFADNQPAAQSVVPGGQSPRLGDHNRALIEACADFGRLGMPYL